MAGNVNTKRGPGEIGSAVMGIETEYAIARASGAASLSSTQAFFRGACPDPIAWDIATEFSLQDARSATVQHPQMAAAKSAAICSVDRVGEQDVDTSGIEVLVHAALSTFLPNGARFYIDHGHPEYCTPECSTARQLVAHDKAGERFLMDCSRRYNATRDAGDRVLLYKNSSDHQGNSYGCHENYSLPAVVYRQLFNERAHWLYTYLVPFLVSRQVFCGGGKVGAELDGADVRYQISQRADFIATVVGLQTQYRRPIVNTRDEPHADPSRWRRLHLICGDPNMAEWSTYLKVAVTQLILEMLAEGALKRSLDVTLADPVAAFRSISRDPELRGNVERERGRPRSALEIQRVFADAAARYVDGGAERAGRWQPVIDDWVHVIETLGREPEALDRVLDWRIKWKFMREQLARKQIDWQSHAAMEMDMRFHQLDDDRGFFYLLRRAGHVEPWLRDGEIDDAVRRPPESTRAFLRGHLVQHYGTHIESGNWDLLNLRCGDPCRTRVLRLSSPTGFSEALVGPLLSSGAGLAEIVDQLSRDNGGRNAS